MSYQYLHSVIMSTRGGKIWTKTRRTQILVEWCSLPVDKHSGPEDKSPLLVSFATSVLSISLSSNSSKQSRLNSCQASAAQLQQKEANDSYKQHYKAVFKEATNQLAEESNTELVKEMLACLND